MTSKQVRDNFVQNLAENAYLNMCTVEEMEIAISALEKQIPKKPYKRKEHKQNDYYCAVCRYYLGDEMELKFVGLQPKFCPNCGQALDWRENDER